MDQEETIKNRANCMRCSIFDTFYAIFGQLRLVNKDMQWLINLLFKKKEIKSNKAIIVQKILLKKYLLR